MSADCWEWNGPRDGRGYGVKMVNYHRHLLHRMAWAWANNSWSEDGPYIPFGMMVCHRCDNPPCCNPDHLRLGTAADNSRDMSDRLRSFQQKKTHCKQGHEFNGDNTVIEHIPGRRPRRVCLTCRTIGRRRRRSEKKYLEDR